MKKYILGALLSLGILISPAFVPQAEAAAFSATQLSAIIGLLQSFGVDQSVINNVQASLTGGAAVVPSSSVTPSSSASAQVSLNGTGITDYADATNNSALPSVAQDTGAFPRQDARYYKTPFNFTQQGAWGVLDNTTGLTWEAAPSLTLYTWADTASYVSSVNAAKLGGYSDWRIPTVKELEGLVDYSIHPIANNPDVPTISAKYFPNTSIDHMFWTSELDVSTGVAFAWAVNFADGSVSRGNQVSWLNHVRLVRGASSPSQFVSTDSGLTVTDNSTGLMWKRDYEMRDPAHPGDYLNRFDTFVWSDALQRAIADKTGGYSDWRVPNVRELESLVDRSVDSPSINTSFFPAPPHGNYFYSSSPTFDYHWNRLVWVVNFDYGQDSLIVPYMTSWVRLVRNSASASASAGAPTHGLTFSKAGSGDGGLNFSKGGLFFTQSGSNTTYTYSSSDTITVTETPGTGSTFAGWSGACSGTASTCTVLMSADRNVIALFNSSTQSGTLCADGTYAPLVVVSPSTGCENHGGVAGKTTTSGNTPTATFSINGQPSAANVDPLVSRTWSWSSTNGSTYVAAAVISGCDTASQNGTVSNWTPWTGGGSGTAASGSTSMVPGAVKYGCTVVATYTVTSSAGQIATASATMTFKHASASSNVAATTPTASFSINGQPSAANVDPLVARTWSWNSANATTYVAAAVISGCDMASQNGMVSNWTPWTGGSGTITSGTAASGSTSMVPGAVKYGCTVVVTYGVRNVAGQFATATATVTFKHSNGIVVVTPPPAQSSLCPDGTPRPAVVVSPSTGCEGHEGAPGTYVPPNGAATTFSNFPNGPWHSYLVMSDNAPIFNYLPVYAKVTGLVKANDPKICIQGNYNAGDRTCLDTVPYTSSVYHSIAASDWIDSTTAVITVSNFSSLTPGNLQYAFIEYSNGQRNGGSGFWYIAPSVQASNSLDGPFVENGTVVNNKPVYVRIRGAGTKENPPQGCTQPVGATGCLNGSAYRDYIPSEWLNFTDIQTIVPDPSIYSLTSYETYFKYPGGSPIKIGGSFKLVAGS